VTHTELTVLLVSFIVLFFAMFFLWLRALKRGDRLRAEVRRLTIKNKGYKHPATNTYCLYCGANRFKEPCDSEVDHTKPPSEKGFYCHICGAAPGKPCDAGLHS